MAGSYLLEGGKICFQVSQCGHYTDDGDGNNESQCSGAPCCAAEKPESDAHSQVMAGTL